MTRFLAMEDGVAKGGSGIYRRGKEEMAGMADPPERRSAVMVGTVVVAGSPMDWEAQADWVARRALEMLVRPVKEEKGILQESPEAQGTPVPSTAGTEGIQVPRVAHVIDNV